MKSTYLIPGMVFLVCVSAFAQPARPRYEARIRRTSYGIPHIQAKDFGSLGFGEGYAQAEDHVCTIADQIVKARGERAKYFGLGNRDENLNNDIAMRALALYERGGEIAKKQPLELRDWYEGYAAGYNRYLAVTPKDKMPAWCRGADWVFPITAIDLQAAQQLLVLITTNFAAQIATAQPPRDTVPQKAAIPWNPPDRASNGWGIGKDLSAGGRGLLVANPHYPWAGANRFWEKHLEIPGTLDVYGVGLIGGPGVTIGFNKDVAWTHTVSAGKRFTFYSLNLAPGKPTVYLYDKQERAMTSRAVKVEVRQPDGSMRTVEREVWFSHYGPVLNLPTLGWTKQRAYAVRDTNWDNSSAATQWLAMGRARSMNEFQEAHARHQGMPFINTMATSKEGVAWYVDGASTPNLSAEAIKLWQERSKSDLVTGMLSGQGIVMLDGSDSRFEWQNDAGARSPGIVAYPHQPKLERTDYIFNANSSFWLANASSPITGDYSPMFGDQATAQSLRTRNNALTLSLRSPDKPQGADNKFSLDEAANAILNNRSFTSALLKDELVERCSHQSSVKDDEGTVDLSDACRILAKWDGRYDLDSRGAVLFREWLGQYANAEFGVKGKVFAFAFDPSDAVGTPRGLTAGPLALENLGKAVRILQSSKLSPDVALGELQYADRSGKRIPIHGGLGGFDGVMNVVSPARNTTTLEPQDEVKFVKGSRFLTEKGYPVTSGTSFLMVLQFTERGPNAKALLTYSESGDAASPHFSDQTELFSRKEWRPVLFTRQQVAADSKRDYVVTNRTSGAGSR